MTQTQDVTATISDLDGTLRATVDQAHGFTIDTFSDDGGQWVRQSASSPFVDGEFDTLARRGPLNLTLVVRAKGADQPHADGLAQALIGWVSTPSLITRTSAGVTTTWRCRVADTTVSFTTVDWLLHERVVTLSIPAQPSPTVVGTVAPA